eukprot:m.57190 g.57190  ORF g.57190 m.57190 type:complete len:83 (-) comp11218_c1_seq4:1046-1294(-)
MKKMMMKMKMMSRKKMQKKSRKKMMKMNRKKNTKREREQQQQQQFPSFCAYIYGIFLYNTKQIDLRCVYSYMEEVNMDKSYY